MFPLGNFLRKKNLIAFFHGEMQASGALDDLANTKINTAIQALVKGFRLETTDFCELSDAAVVLNHRGAKSISIEHLGVLLSEKFP